jgi:competence protein ComEC
MAGGAAVGALWAHPLPLLGAVGLTAAALVARRPALLAAGVVLLVSALAARSWAGLDPLPATRWSGVAQLVSDPEVAFGAVQVVVEVDGHRVEAWARGAPGAALRERLAGERVWVVGDLGPLRGSAAGRLASRHVVGHLEVTSVGGWAPGGPLARLANGVRRLLMAGTGSFSAEQRSLYAGIVLGDDRTQGPALAAAFQGAGLTHLLAVSGQNVAFLLAVLAPGLRRLRLWPRFGVTIAALGFFALTTRFEPSVLRAVVMAGLAALAATLGRPVSSLQVLCLAVVVLLALDPLLVHQVGFQLSVLATFGIVTLAEPIARRLPLPRPVALPAAVTVAAQVATAPLLVARFGPVPVASLPANLLAEPAAAGAMMYGLGAGLPAGLLTAGLGPLPAAVIHLPTRLMVWWLAAVARWGDGLPLGHVGARELAVIFAGAPAVAVCRALRRRRDRERRRGQDRCSSGTVEAVRNRPSGPR